MQPITFPEANVVYGANQAEYKPLPGLKFPSEDGMFITCWQLTDEEIETIKGTKCVWLSLMTFNQPLPPVFLTTNKDELIIHKEEENVDNELENSEKSE